MKVIDLLNKIANGEEVPKQIKYEGKIYTYDENFQDYKMFDNYGSNWLINKIFDESEDTLYALGYELEIIEEDKEMSKITKEEFERLDKRTLLELIVKNQNELIDVVSELKKGK